MEWPFGLLQSLCAIARHPVRTWSKEITWEITWVIMHNMIVEEECDDNMYDQWWEF
jgi:hypothetical protein